MPTSPADVVNYLADSALGLGGMYISGRLLLAHVEERRGLRAKDPEVRRRHQLDAETLRQLASLQHPLFLIALFIATLAKIVAAAVLLLSG